MTLDQAALVAGGAVGGMLYPLLGYFKAKKTETKVSFDIKKFLSPVFYGAVTGIVGVFISPMLGLGQVVDINTAVSTGIGGAVIIEKLLTAEKEDLQSLVSRVKE